MKKKITKLMGIGLSFVLVASLMVVFAPVAAAADYKENDWDTWGMPSLETDTDIGPMAVAPDGTIFAAVLDQGGLVWEVQKSEDDGYTWDGTEFELEFDNGNDDPEWPDDVDWDELEDNAIVEIAIGKNYEDDEILYVGTWGGTIYRLEEAGDGDVIAIREIPSTNGIELYSIDTWSDGDENWILAGTDDGVFEIEDAHGGDWVDYQLRHGHDPDKPRPAYEVAYAPDFEDEELMWVITEGWIGDPYYDRDCFMITSTKAPGQWGQVVGEVRIPETNDATPWVDLGFPDSYDSNPDTGDTILFAALSSDGGNGGVYLIEGVDEDEGDSNAMDLFDLAGEAFAPTNIVSLAVSGDYPDCVILAGALSYPTIYWSDDGGDDWSDADKNPTGQYDFEPPFGPGVPEDPFIEENYFSWTHVYMEADVTWGGDVFDVEESVSFVSTFGDESAVSRSYLNEDGDLLYNQVGYIDTYIDAIDDFSGIDDIAFHPDFPATPTFLMTTDNRTTMWTDSVWLTENGDSDEPDYMRVLCGYDGAPGNFAANKIRLVEFSQDGDAIYIFGMDDTGGMSIWKSTDDGQTFDKRRTVQVGGDEARINDWVITDDRTIYAAVDDGDNDGFYMTINSGLSWSDVDTDGPMNSIAMSPDFEDGEGFILLGGMSGQIMLSDNDGDTFDDAEDEEQSGLASDGTIFVAFDADFANEDADGYMYIYAADDAGSEIQEGEVADTDDVNWDDLEDDDGDGDPQGIFATGLVVSEDNALYAIGEMTEAVTLVVTVSGDCDLTGEDSTNDADFDLVDVEVDVDSGTFEDGEDATVIGAALVAESSTVASGTIYIEGDTSEAIGSFEQTFIADGWGLSVFPPFYEAVYVDFDDLVIEVASQAVDTGLARLLLNESNNLWESADDDDLDDPMGLWFSLGSNVLWTIDAAGDDDEEGEMWVLEDTLSGQVTLDSPPDGYKSDSEDQMLVAWDEMRDADEYEVKYYHVPTGDSEVEDGIEDTDILLKQLSDSSEYEWKVRVSPGEPWHSRWSGKWTFHTALGEPPWTPTLYTPGGVWQYSGIDVDLMPAFSWESAQSADGYQFILADNAAFTSPLVNEKVPESAYQLDFELEYNSNYFWKVMAYKGTEALSRWSDIGAFTTVETAPPAPPAPAPPATVTQPAPAPIVLPTPIPPVLLWVIIGVGALLIVAVIVLIVRTRRPI